MDCYSPVELKVIRNPFDTLWKHGPNAHADEKKLTKVLKINKKGLIRGLRQGVLYQIVMVCADIGN